jgi:hypothetical protein
MSCNSRPSINGIFWPRPGFSLDWDNGMAIHLSKLRLRFQTRCGLGLTRIFHLQMDANHEMPIFDAE